MSNFTFISDSFPGIFKKLKIAESRVLTEPGSAANYIRQALEESIHIIYKEYRLDVPYDEKLSSLIREAIYHNVIPSSYKEPLAIIRKTGNHGVHFGYKLKGREVMVALQYALSYFVWFAELHADVAPDLPEGFDKSFIPKVGAKERALKVIREEADREKAQQLEEQAKQQAEIEKLKQQLAQQNEAALASEAAMLALQQEKEEIRAQLSQRAVERNVKPSHAFTEAETRVHLIDIALREAGWHDLQEGKDLEYPVNGMPVTNDNPHGNGYVDYVLWDDNGLPLGLIEAKRTSVDPAKGRHQASLYADCLEQMHGQRPVIFYSNGYETYLWDDRFYSAPRRVYGFYTKDELQYVIQRRTTRKDLRNAKVNTAISGRPYQIEAINRTAETWVTDGKAGLAGARREALLVMATGSGKTRTAAAIVDVLFKSNWIKRVLFLADRNALVRQAKNSFNEHLPDLSAINLTQEKENNTTRLVFSTYQSMINRIDGERSDDERFYGVGHFDLIIIDEAHRSVYNKYGDIFDYFDSLLLGLTATPKDHVDHNTFDLFDCQDGDPTFAYELDDAVHSGFLVPYESLNVSTKFIRDGINYHELPAEDKVKYEEQFRDGATGQFPEHIRNSALHKWLFNKPTVNIILDELLENGLKIEDGDKLGRTIIFAANQRHAEFIHDCFVERYPQMPSGFMKVVHTSKSHAQSIIETFCNHHKENLPQIAVSVDMMDTGIDAPRVLNLVFFKVVRSYAKFWQMIGRGTRLCPDVYGMERPKTGFRIFDVCENFKFFGENAKGRDAHKVESLSQRIFNTRLDVAVLLRDTQKKDHIELASEFTELLHLSIKNLDTNRFDVNMRYKHVERYADANNWTQLSPSKVDVIKTNLSALPTPQADHPNARRFDLMMLKMMQASLLTKSSKKYENELITIAVELDKIDIPQINKSKALLQELKDPDFYKTLHLRKMDEIRAEIRELLQYIEPKGIENVYTMLGSDELVSGASDPVEPYGTSELYRARVEKFIRDNANHIVISKLNTNQQITADELTQLQQILFDGDERGTYEQYKESYGDKPLGVFIRSIVGLKIETAQEAFSEFLQAGNLNANQMKFVDLIIQHLNRNGTIDKRLLFESPFNEAHDEGLVGVFDDSAAMAIVKKIDSINENANVG